MTIKDELIDKINKKTATVAVLGLGYVGLPLAAVFAEAGFTVIGVDPVKEKVDAINRGESYILDIPSETVSRLVQAGKLSATTDFAACARADAVSICVPTPCAKPAIQTCPLSFLPPKVLLRISIPEWSWCSIRAPIPAQTREMVLPRLAGDGGLKAGQDFFIIHAN